MRRPTHVHNPGYALDRSGLTSLSLPYKWPFPAYSTQGAKPHFFGKVDMGCCKRSLYINDIFTYPGTISRWTTLQAGYWKSRNWGWIRGGCSQFERTAKKAKHILRHCSSYCDIPNNQCIQLMFQWYTESALLWKNTKKARLNTIGKRLLPDTDKETWLEFNQPKWHLKCRNW